MRSIEDLNPKQAGAGMLVFYVYHTEMVGTCDGPNRIETVLSNQHSRSKRVYVRGFPVIHALVNQDPSSLGPSPHTNTWRRV